MEFPDIGQHCSEDTCHKLDFLPLKCDACGQVFCREHISYKDHNCTSAYKKDVQVPVCPLCNTPIPLKKGETPDVVVGRHIDNDCQSDSAKNNRKVFSNKCSAKGCKIREAIPLICEKCKLNFCLKHRHEADHQCEGETSAARRKAREAALARQKAQKEGPSQIQNGQIQNAATSRGKQRSTVADVQGTMSEDEALAQALALSMQEASQSAVAHRHGSLDSPTQIESDFMLARVIAESQQQQQTSSARSSSNKCAVS